jgi:hypothetical protein
MKIRNGFVSNSSSSSFIILGVKTDEKLGERERTISGRVKSIYFEEIGYINGIVIESDEYLNKSTNFVKLQEMAQEVSEALKVDINEVELITLTTYC